MTQKEDEDSLMDYKFLSKYIREDSDENKQENLKKQGEQNLLHKKFEIGNHEATEVISRIGEGGSYPENQNFYKRQEDRQEFEEPDEKIEVISNPISDAKQEFLKDLEDDSLTIDTCSKLNHDWKRK